MSLNLVLEEVNGSESPIYNDKGEILVHNTEINQMVFVPISNELLQSYPQLQVEYESMDTFEPGNSKSNKAYWTHEATILLINKYKHYQPKFNDSIHTNTQVWDMIAEEFKKDDFSFCGTQCESRWKYIRGKYIKKKDNAGAGNTGDENYQFEYYNEIDEILGAKPNIVPKHVASSSSSLRSNVPSSSSNVVTNSNASLARSNVRSSRSTKSCDGCIIFEDEDEDVDRSSVNSEASSQKGKHRKEPWEESVKRQESYHNEMMEVQRESLKTFQDVMMKMLECFKPKND